MLKTIYISGFLEECFDIDHSDYIEKQIFKKIKAKYPNLYLEGLYLKYIDEKKYSLFLNDKGWFYKRISEGEYKDFFPENVDIDKYIDIKFLLDVIDKNNLNLVADIIYIKPSLINEQRHYSTPLSRAVFKDNPKMVKMLLKYGALHLPDYGGGTPLYYAAHRGQLKIVKLLLKYGASHLPDYEGTTPLLLAAENGHLEVVKVLLNPSFYLKKQGIPGAAQNPDIYNHTPLYFASYYGHLEVVKVLLNPGPGIPGAELIHTNSGKTALYWATRNGHTKIVKILKKHFNI